MCKIITILNNNPDNNQTISKFIQDNLTYLETERDGYSIFNGQEARYFHGIKAYENIEKNIIYNNEKLLIVHARTATGGENNINGLHLQPIQNNYYFAHNGWVSNYATVSKKSDSYYFFRNYISDNNINAQTIEQEVKKRNFTGKGFIYDKKEEELHIFMNQTLYIYALPDCLILTSYMANFHKIEKYKEMKILGYTFNVKIEPDKQLASTQVNNQYLLFKKNNFISRQEIKTNMPLAYNNYWHPRYKKSIGKFNNIYFRR